MIRCLPLVREDGFNPGVMRTLLEPFWPSRRAGQFDELCQPAA